MSAHYLAQKGCFDCFAADRAFHNHKIFIIFIILSFYEGDSILFINCPAS
jgi:hypothetical protein